MAFYIKQMWLIKHVHAEMILCFEIYCSYCEISKCANIFYPAHARSECCNLCENILVCHKVLKMNRLN